MTAAAKLLGLTLVDDWKVIEQIERQPCSTGGMFSHSYLARKGSRIAFVKAFDFSGAFEPEVDTLKLLGFLTASYENERDVLEHCRGQRLSRIVIAIGHGHVDVPNLSLMEGRVYYLLFENAVGDIRCQMDDAEAFDAVWCLYALRHVCLGLWQIHRQLIAHQDLKPSNVLCYGPKDFRVSDFGRSSRRGHTIWHDDLDIPGDKTYAPPELLYGYAAADFVSRRIGADLYMLGNLASFLFTGVNVTESLMTRLEPQHHWTRWGSQYQDVLAYLHEAFGGVLEELETRLPGSVRSEILLLVSQLCNPDLSLRGHPRSRGRPNQFSLERYVSHLTHFALILEIRTRVKGSSI